MVCAHGIANYWQWGHNGYNGAAFSQAARNTLRFGVLAQAPYHTGLSPPPVEALYTHHPLLLHLHLVAGFALFGVEEWVARSVPAAYSVGALILVCLLVARYRDRATALAAAVLYATIPLNLIFANMVNHEQGCIFWSLGLLYSYLRWRDTALARYGALAFVCVSMAMQFDWAGYYIAFAVALHAFVEGVRAGRRARRRASAESSPGLWNRRFTFVVVFSGVVLMNTAVFFGWIAIARGNLLDMWGAFSERTEPGTNYLTQQAARLFSLQGPVPVLLLMVWLVKVTQRRRRGLTCPLDMVVLTFLFAQLVHSSVFQKAGSVHTYWTYYLNPALAIAGGDAVVSIWRSSNRVAARLKSLAPTPFVVGALLLGAIVFQGFFARHQYWWGISTGSVSLIEEYDDQFAEIMWAKEVARHFPRPTATFVLNPSIKRRRIELDYYLDAPIETRLTPESKSSTPHRVWLLDLENVDRSDPEWSLIRHVASLRPCFVWDRRFIAIDLAGSAPEVTAFLSQNASGSIWWDWLVSSTHAPIRWIPDNDSQQVQRLLTASGDEH